MQKTLIALLIVVSLGITACASKRPKVTSPPPSSEATTGADANGLNSSTAGAVNGTDEDTAGPQAGLLAKRTIYFDFDNSEIKGEATAIVAAHAKYLASNPSARLRLEGNTDERGSNEYNIGLGERRAQAVRRALLLQGASDGQLSTVSYGEERPAAAGHDEQAWAMNRRVEIVYLTGNALPVQK